MTSRDFPKNLFVREQDPMYVINNSQEGDKRAEAFRRLKEPIRNGGTQQDQDAVVTVLVYAAANDRQALCRQAAIFALREFQDPRAVEGLKEAYYKASNFQSDSATVIRCLALSAMGNTRNPAAIDLLVKVLREPDVQGAEVDKLQSMDVRIAAARALGNFHTKDAAEALVAALKSDQDPLHMPAYESLVAATGRHLPRDPQVWDDLVRNAGKDGTLYVEPTFTDRVKEILPTSFVP
jgi:HEAT repeat protein